MFNFLSRIVRGRGGDDRKSTAPVNAVAPASPLATAPVHVLRDEGLVRLVDGQLAYVPPAGAAESVRLDELSQLSLFGNAGVTSPCLRELMRRGVPVVWRSAGGRYIGQTADLSGQALAVRRAQYRAVDDPVQALAIARAFVRGKIVNARGVLRRSEVRAPRTLADLRRLARQAGRAAKLPQLLGIEGAAAAAYYAAFPEMIVRSRREDFRWNGRTRQPPADPMNALLSYLYAVVCGECAVAALGAGLDPTLGFLHAERPGRPALALDLLEPFRPAIADALALAVVNRGEARLEHFDRTEAAVRLTDGGRRLVIAALERRWNEPLPTQTAGAPAITWRDAVTVQARNLAVALRSGQTFTAVERG